jgi:hypothetical protein
VLNKGVNDELVLPVRHDLRLEFQIGSYAPKNGGSAELGHVPVERVSGHLLRELLLIPVTGEAHHLADEGVITANQLCALRGKYTLSKLGRVGVVEPIGAPCQALLCGPIQDRLQGVLRDSHPEGLAEGLLDVGRRHRAVCGTQALGDKGHKAVEVRAALVPVGLEDGQADQFG